MFRRAPRCVLSLVLLGFIGLGVADEPPLEKGFRSLFNGKDLAGWHKNPAKIGHGTGGRWVVEDGAIVGEQDPPGSGNGGILLTDETFGDFEVVFEVKPDWGPDSGFFLRSTDKGQCYQMMIDFHDRGNVGEIYREGLDGASNRTFQIDGVYEEGTGRLKSIVASATAEPENQKRIDPAKWGEIWKFNDWNKIKIRCVGNPPTIDTWINGHHVTTYTSDKTFEGTLKERGHLAVQVHGGTGAWPKGTKIRFRRIAVKEL